MEKCNKSCSSHQSVEPVPYIAHEASMARMERTIKRLWILLIILSAMLVATNGAWIWHEAQFEDVVTTIEAEQDADNGSNYAVVGDFAYGKAES